jgi:hypothetical protein
MSYHGNRATLHSSAIPSPAILQTPANVRGLRSNLAPCYPEQQLSHALSAAGAALPVWPCVCVGCEPRPLTHAPHAAAQLSSTPEAFGPNWIYITHYEPVKFSIDGTSMKWYYPTNPDPACNVLFQVYTGSTTVRKTPIAQVLQPFVTYLPIRPAACPSQTSGVYSGVTSTADPKVT